MFKSECFKINMFNLKSTQDITENTSRMTKNNDEIETIGRLKNFVIEHVRITVIFIFSKLIINYGLEIDARKRMAKQFH